MQRIWSVKGQWAMMLTVWVGAACLIPLESEGLAIRGDNPWAAELRSWYDDALGYQMWTLNLGPTGIRAKILPSDPDQFLVAHVFQDEKSPAKGKVQAGDVIVGANGKTFSTRHRFSRRTPKDGRGWDGPLKELAGHIEDSQGQDGVLQLMVRPQGDNSVVNTVELQLEPVGRFAPTFPFNCPRSAQMLEKLCDFLVHDYESDNWKKPNQFYGGVYAGSHQILALMASGIDKYEPIIEDYRKQFYGNTYSPTHGGFRMWRWGYEAIIMGEMYNLYQDRKLVEPMHSLAKAMPWGSFDRSGIYTHRSFINIRQTGRKPYASIAAISGLQFVGQSIFRHLGLHYEEDLHETIYGHYLRAAKPDALRVSYAFPERGESPLGRDARHAIIKLADPTQARGEKGPGYVVPTGMKDVTEYTIEWPTKADHRWKPTDWVEEERDQNIVEELKGDIRRVNRYLGDIPPPEDPTKPYDTTASHKYLASIGMAAVGMTMGTPPRPGWEYLGRHAANTCALGPGNIFDGHAASNLHGFWAVLGAARSNDPEALRAFLDYMKIFLVLSEVHDGHGLYMQPWGRDRANADLAYGPRLLPTATGIMILSLPKKRLLLTGADAGTSAAPAASRSGLRTGGGAGRTSGSGTGSGSFDWAAPPPWAQSAAKTATPEPQLRPARSLSPEKLAILEQALQTSLVQLSEKGYLTEVPMQLSITRGAVWLQQAAEGGVLTFGLVGSDRVAEVPWRSLTTSDQAILAALVATLRKESSDAQALAGVYLEHAGSVRQADAFFAKADEDSRKKLERLFD